MRFVCATLRIPYRTCHNCSGGYQSPQSTAGDKPTANGTKRLDALVTTQFGGCRGDELLRRTAR